VGIQFGRIWHSPIALGTFDISLPGFEEKLADRPSKSGFGRSALGIVE
jgi:hypothetical protein